MPVYTLTTVTLLTELLLAPRENNADGFKLLMNLGLQELGLVVVEELTGDFLVPLLSETEADRMIAWYWGLSLYIPVIAGLLKPCEQHHRHL